MLEEKILETINKHNLIDKEDNIIIGVSGGPDSICLLNALNNLKEKLKFNIVVCHINHCLRENAIIDEEFVIEFCKKKNIECYVKRADVKGLVEEKKISTEEAGRILRYNFFEEIMLKTKANKIATAHNANDNAETMIMNLLRGTGVAGLKGIEIIRDEKYIRPLIECERTEIERYCLENNLNPRHDETNDENIYTRNKIRNQIIPYIKENFNPNIVEGLNRLSKIVQDEEKYFIKTISNEYNNIVVSEEKNKSIKIDVKKFNKLDIVIRRRMVLYIIKTLSNTSKGIEKIHIEDIIKMCDKNLGNKYLLIKKNLKIYINKGIVEYRILAV